MYEKLFGRPVGLSGVLCAAMICTPAWAQVGERADAPEEEDQVELQTFEVTGSRIRRVDFESAQPVVVLTREDIERTGLVNIGDLLQEVPMAGSALNRTFNNGGTGTTEVDLRNLGSNRTLVLVDGHRWINGTSFAGTGAVDLNTIPTAIIERIEILKDGASAIYGSDAIAGVINFITRKDVTGVQASTQFGAYNAEDGLQQQHNLSFGTVGSNTSMFTNFSFTRQNALFAGDRERSSVPLFGTGITRGSIFTPRGTVLFVPNQANQNILNAANSDNCQDLGAGVVNGTVEDELGFDPGLTIPNQASGLTLCNIILQRGETVNPGETTAEVAARYKPFDTFEDPYNFAPINYLLTPFEQTSVFTQINHRFNDLINFSGQVLYNKSRTERELAETPLIFGNLLFPPFDQVYVADDQFYNPFDQDIGNSGEDGLIGLGIVGRRFQELGPRTLTRDTETIYLRPNINGSFDALGRFFSWELGYSFGTSVTTNRHTGDLNMENVKRALGPAEFCGGDPRVQDGTIVANETADPDCVPLDIFGGPGSITQEQLDYVSYNAASSAESQVRDLYGNLSFDFPGSAEYLPAPIGMALGFEIRNEKFEDQPDALVEQGLSSTNLRRSTKGSISGREAFVELDIPMFAGIDFVESLDLNLAVRYTNFDSYDPDLSGKVGIRWQPFSDLLVRATGSQSFRAPSITDLFLAATDSYPSVTDPCVGRSEGSTTDENCDAEGVDDGVTQPSPQILTQFGGNQNLEPETADTFTAGFVFSPSAIPEFNIYLDYFDIKLDNFIGFLSPQLILDLCYTADRSSGRPAVCDFVDRNDGGAGSIRTIQARSFNFAKLETRGIDVAFDYVLPVNDWFSGMGLDVPGRFVLSADSQYLISYEQFVPNSDGSFTGFELKGLNLGDTPLPKLKINAELTWDMGPYGFSWSTRFIQGTWEQCNDGLSPPVQDFGLCDRNDEDLNTDQDDDVDGSLHKLEDVFYHDIQFTWTPPFFNQGELTLGVRNLFNEQPPVSYQAFSNSFPATLYEPPDSREPYLRMKVAF